MSVWFVRLWPFPMKIRTFNSNLVAAIDNDTGVLDRNLPVYISDYDVRTVPSSSIEEVHVRWSTVGFVPSYEMAERILHVRLCASVRRTPSSTTPLTEMTFLLDFSRLGNQFMDRWNITLKGPLEGYLTDGMFGKCLSAYRHISYQYDATTFTLLLYVRDLPPIETSSDEPIDIFIDLSIKDDINDPDYPTAYPINIASIVYKIPINTPYRGKGVTVVMPMFICCPDQLKTMQLSSVDPLLEGAFNPEPEIRYLLDLQRIAAPERIDIQYIDAAALPPSEDNPVNWKEDFSMRSIAYFLQAFLSIVPEVSIIVLYSIETDISQPSYMTWLRDNVDQYDMVVQTQTLVKNTNWTTPAFQAAAQFYETVQQQLFANGKTFLVATGNNGTEENITSPNRGYDFNVASTFTIAVGGFQLARDPETRQYNLQGPYEGAPLSNGGYSNTIPRPSFQYGINYRNLYGRPDVAGYMGFYFATVNPPEVDSVYGTQLATVMLASLFVMIQERNERHPTNFKFALYRKGPTCIQQIYQGQNIGTTPVNRYDARNYPYWNPIVGMGNVHGGYFYEMCNVIRNFQVIQISSSNQLNHPMSFLNFMPPNTFGDLLTRQPAMGCSSIFSLFRIQRVTGSGDPVPDNEPIRNNDTVYLVDLTQRFALAYALDDEGKWYVVVSRVNYGSDALKWILRSPFESSPIGAPIYAFDLITILPSLQPLYSLSTRWNASGAAVPNAPSISQDVVNVPETFVLNIDPAATNSLDAILSALSNDLTGYSYYVNFNSFAEDVAQTRGDSVFLNNPDFVGMDSPPVEVYDARNRANTTRVSPKWGFALDPYPQWVLVPVPCTFSNPNCGPYQTQLLRGGQFMVFNTVLQSYMYAVENRNIPPERPMVYLRPISASVTDTLPFYTFVFTFTDETSLRTRISSPPLFTGTPPTVNGLPPNVVIDPFTAGLYIYNLFMDTGIGRDGQFITIGFLDADINQTADLLVEESVGDVILADEMGVYWVFKKYIATQATASRFIAYNDFVDVPQQNSTLALCARGSPTNVNNHAPSLRREGPVVDPAFYWFNVTNTSITDLNYPASASTIYGILNEGLTIYNVQATEWQILSLLEPSPPMDPNVVMALGVFGGPPQPVLLPEPFSNMPMAIRWNASTLNRFYAPPYDPYPGPVRRTNYLYLNTVYSLYTNNPQNYSGQLAGFLSSASNFGAAPSIVGTGIQPVMDGDSNTFFLLLPLTPS